MTTLCSGATGSIHGGSSAIKTSQPIRVELVRVGAPIGSLLASANLVLVCLRLNQQVRLLPWCSGVRSSLWGGVGSLVERTSGVSFASLAAPISCLVWIAGS